MSTAIQCVKLTKKYPGTRGSSPERLALAPRSRSCWSPPIGNRVTLGILIAYVVVTGVVAGLLLQRRQLDLH